MDFWSKFDGWKWNCSAFGTKAKESEELESEIEKSGEEPEWLMTEWVNKMMAVKHNKHNLTELVRKELAWASFSRPSARSLLQPLPRQGLAAATVRAACPFRRPPRAHRLSSLSISLFSTP